MELTKKQIETELKRWQKHLRLQDWAIKLKFVEADRLNDDGDKAKIWRLFYHQTGTITLARDRKDEEILGSIIHELLHIVWYDTENVLEELCQKLPEPAASIARNLYNDYSERAINRIRDAFVNLAN